MARFLKIAAILVGVVVGLLALAAVALAILVDPNRYRDDIVRAVKEQTGRDLRIEGDLSLSFYPWLGLETGRLELANAGGFGPEPFAVVASSETKVELWPLLRREVVVDAVRLNGVKLHLARKADGRTNWDDLAAPEAGEQEPQPGRGGAEALALFTVERLELRDAAFTWRDEMANASYTARNVNVTSGDLLSPEPAPLRLAFDLEGTNPPIQRRVELNARLRFDPQAEAIEAPELRLAFGDLRLQAEVRGKDLLSAPKVNGSVEIAAFDPRALLAELGAAYRPADPEALRTLALSARFGTDPQLTGLADIRLTLDDTHLTGEAALRHAAPGTYLFDLAIDTLDLDRYLPAGAAGDEGERGGAEAAAAPVALLRDADASGELRIGKLEAFGMTAEEMSTKVTAKGGRIALVNAAKLYGGTYAGQTTIDASGRVLRLRFDEKLAGVRLGPLLEDAGVFDSYQGTGNVALALTARGLDSDQLTRTLSGTATIDLRDGKIEGVNLQQIVRQAQALLARARGEEAEASARPGDETAFDALTATIRVRDGIARNEDLRLAGPVVRAKGAGTANLVEETLDYRLQVTLAEARGREGTTFPVGITGPFADLNYRVEIGSLLQERLKERVEEKLERGLKEEIEEGLERLRDKLRR